MNYFIFVPISDFDRYYKSLVPRMMPKNACKMETSQTKDSIINCRNIWFREFWSQHNKCQFDQQKNNIRGRTRMNAAIPTRTDGDTTSTTSLCTGKEQIAFEQEGLVPFVGKYFVRVFLSHSLLMCC